MDDKIKDVLREFKGRLTALYGARLKGVYLFGSYARSEADEESDVDTLIVLDNVGDYSHEVELTGYAASELSLKHGVTISRVFVPEQRWREDQTMFYLNVREEAVAV